MTYHEKALKLLRKARGERSQYSFSQDVGMGRANYRKLELGDMRPSGKTAFVLELRFGIPAILWFLDLIPNAEDLRTAWWEDERGRIAEEQGVPK